MTSGRAQTNARHAPAWVEQPWYHTSPSILSFRQAVQSCRPCLYVAVSTDSSCLAAAQINGQERLKLKLKMSNELMLTELKALPDDVRTFKSVGKAWVRKGAGEDAEAPPGSLQALADQPPQLTQNEDSQHLALGRGFPMQQHQSSLPHKATHLTASQPASLVAASQIGSS